MSQLRVGEGAAPAATLPTEVDPLAAEAWQAEGGGRPFAALLAQAGPEAAPARAAGPAAAHPTTVAAQLQAFLAAAAAAAGTASGTHPVGTPASSSPEAQAAAEAQPDAQATDGAQADQLAALQPNFLGAAAAGAGSLDNVDVRAPAEGQPPAATANLLRADANAASLARSSDFDGGGEASNHGVDATAGAGIAHAHATTPGLSSSSGLAPAADDAGADEAALATPTAASLATGARGAVVTSSAEKTAALRQQSAASPKVAADAADGATALEPKTVAPRTQARVTSTLAAKDLATGVAQDADASATSVKLSVGAAVGAQIGTASVQQAGGPRGQGTDEQGAKDEDAATDAAAAGQALANLGAVMALLAAQPATPLEAGVQAVDVVTSQSLLRGLEPSGVAASGTAALGDDQKVGSAGDAAAAALGREGAAAAAGQQPAVAATAAESDAAAKPAADDRALGGPAARAEGAKQKGRAGQQVPAAVAHRRGMGAAEAAGFGEGDGAGPISADVGGQAHDATSMHAGALAGLHGNAGTTALEATQARHGVDAGSTQVASTEVGQELAAAVQRGSRSIALRVAPPGVGELGIHVRIIGNQVRMRIAGEAPELAHVLRANASALQASLQAKGLQLDTLDFQPRGPGQDASAGSGSSNGAPAGDQFGQARSDDAPDSERIFARRGRGPAEGSVTANARAGGSATPIPSAGDRVLYVTL